jgi:hypothetical protein
MRCVGYCLNYLSEAAVAHLVQQQREENRNRELGDKVIYAKRKGIEKNLIEIVGVKKLYEVFQANPRAAEDAFGR